MQGQDSNAALLAQLRDIRGLDPMPWWPPAPGWWYLLCLIVVLAVLYRVAWRALTARKLSRAWQEDAMRILCDLKSDKLKADKDKAASLSVLLRKLAIRKHGRAACAGLEGEEWLRWLARNDPSGFDWEREGRILIDAPYAPDGPARRPGVLDRIVQAVEGWVR